MKAIVKFALGEDGMGVLDVPEPTPKEGELKVRVIAAGICGGDLYSMRDVRKTIMPVTLGHEYVGEIVETCGDVGTFKVGDRVVTLPACYSCGTCEFCRAGKVTLCPERASIGTHRNGAMAEYVVVPAKYSFKVPDSVEDAVPYALSEPFTCAVRGVYERLQNVKAGDVAVVTGPGNMGQFAIQALLTLGVKVVAYGLPQDKSRLELAVKMGAEAGVDNYEDLEREVKKLNPRGADIVVDASGHPAALKVCLDIAGTGSQLLTLGYFGGHTIEVDYDITHVKEMTVYGSNSTAMSSWKIAMELINSGKVDLSPYVSLKLPLSEWKRGFNAVLNKEGYKVVFCPELDK